MRSSRRRTVPWLLVRLLALFLNFNTRCAIEQFSRSDSKQSDEPVYHTRAALAVVAAKAEMVFAGMA